MLLDSKQNLRQLRVSDTLGQSLAPETNVLGARGFLASQSSDASTTVSQNYGAMAAGFR